MQSQIHPLIYRLTPNRLTLTLSFSARVCQPCHIQQLILLSLQVGRYASQQRYPVDIFCSAVCPYWQPVLFP